MPLMSVAICVEGVLQKSSPSIRMDVGVALYHSLKSNFNILLYSDQSKKELDYWLSLEALNSHSAVEYTDDILKYLANPDRKVSQVNSLRARGFHIDLVIEPDPDASSVLIGNGYSVMTFTHAQYSLPEWRPDYQEKRKPWQEFADESRKLAELKAMDRRMKEAESH
jgi:hypothetical protein